MPIYEYECKKCGNLFEILLFNRNSEVRCPQCKDKDVRRLISAFRIASSKSDTSGLNTDYSNTNSCSSCGSRQCSTCSVK